LVEEANNPPEIIVQSSLSSRGQTVTDTSYLQILQEIYAMHQ